MGFFKKIFGKKETVSEPPKIIDAESHGLDPMFEDAARLVLRMSCYSISSLSRKLNIGYNQADRITDELEKVGIIGPIIEPMVPREILINDEKKLEEVLLSIQKNGLLLDKKVCTITDDETKHKIEEIRQSTIEISKSNYKDYSSLDIVAFSFAVPGAQGEGGGIYLITSDQNIYHMNFVFGDMTIDDAIHICPPLADCRFTLFGADKIPSGWNYQYMGAGNHLFVRDSILNDVFERTTGLERVELYQQWKAIVMEVLENCENSKVLIL